MLPFLPCNNRILCDNVIGYIERHLAYPYSSRRDIKAAYSDQVLLRDKVGSFHARGAFADGSAMTG